VEKFIKGDIVVVPFPFSEVYSNRVVDLVRYISKK